MSDPGIKEFAPGGRLLVVGQVPPPIHGSNVMTAELLSSLKRISVSAVFVDKRLSRRIDEVGKLGLGKALRSVGLALRLLTTAVRRGPFQACIYFTACSRGAFLVDAILITLLRSVGVDVVPYLHGIGYRDLSFTNRFWGYVVAAVFTRSRRAIVLGEAGGRDLEQWISNERLVVIPNTIPDQSPQMAAISADSRCRLLYISSLLPSKGAMEFVLAARSVSTEIPNAEFLIAGQSYDSEFDKGLREVAASIGRQGTVQFLGPVYDTAKNQLLASADVFVFPTRYEFENQPLVVLEAMGAGLPVISTRVGCIPEQVEDHVNGYLVEAGDVVSLGERMKELCLRPDERKRMGAAGRRMFLERFSRPSFDRRWARFVRETESSSRDEGTPRVRTA